MPATVTISDTAAPSDSTMLATLADPESPNPEKGEYAFLAFSDSESGSPRRIKRGSSTYPGGKAQDGVFQKIINQLPPHSVYIEPFVGAGAVLRHKKPAQYSIAIDADPVTCARLRSGEFGKTPALTVILGDAISFLRAYPWTGQELVYLDPPYLFDVRSSKRNLYDCEFGEEAQHLELLSLIRTLPAAIAISGYHSDLYAQELVGWRSISFTAVTRGGSLATEWLWMNYPEPVELHDYSYLGKDFRERERIQRKKRRWVRRLATMPALERYALLSSIAEYSEAARLRGGT